jgi:putative ABC transport system permease protein
MSLNIRPIMSALLRNRTGAMLVVLQIALALAILVNSAYVVKQRIDLLTAPTGVDDHNMFAIEFEGFTQHYNFDTSLKEDLAYLRGLDGVVSASASNNVPESGGGSSFFFYKTPARRSADAVWGAVYEMDEHGLETLGSHLIAGRSFRTEEILPPVTPENQLRPFPVMLVTQAMAQSLFPDGNALGKVTYDPLGRPVTVIGIVSNMEGPYSHDPYHQRVFFVPQLPRLFGLVYLVRTKPGQLEKVMSTAAEHLKSSSVDRVIEAVRSVDTYKRRSYQSDRITAIVLTFVTCLLIAVAAFGIFGLATFNVSTRTKQIGTRRAVGARKRDIIRHFLVENGLITSAGILVGCALALGVGYGLSVQYNLPRLDLYYLVGGVLALWAIGQLAAWQPARKAAKVPPSVATRTA